MGKFSQLGQDLYDGTVSVDFVGRRRLWYAISAVILGVAISGLVWKGLNLGIEFEGGVEYRVSTSGQATQDDVDVIRDAVIDTAGEEGIEAASAPIVNTSGDDTVRVQTEPLDNDETTTISEAIQEAAGVDAGAISQDAIGATWGQQVADRAILGLVAFVVLVSLFIWAYFREWKMSVAALIALAHDLIITVGVYALSGFEVTPATVTGVLTILGFSLYDTVVVFDKVRENTKALRTTRQTYREASNLAVNQTLVRSVNTSIVALLPVGAILWVSVVTLGSGALKDLALALFVGMAAGLYSSVFIATPLLVQLKELEPGVRAGDKRALASHKRKHTDPFASAPAYADDLPSHDEEGRGGRRGRAVAADAVEDEPVDGGVAVSSSRAPGSRPLGQSAASKRNQPQRRPRSQRGKK